MNRFSWLILNSLLFFFGQISIGFSQSNFSPKQFLGYEIGEKFTRHAEVVSYFNALQTAFPKMVKVEKYGETYEHRDLLQVFIGTPENIANLEQIRNNHVALNSDDKLAIVWMSYNVHGNESAGTEAAMQTAYRLLTDKVDLLKNTLIIMDPCLNPDGRDRYVNYYYQYGAHQPNPEIEAIEHQEPWPSGRPNHYLFDLNRDWAWMTQIETQQRMNSYFLWNPHVHVDFHEQGINEPYYFPPAAEPYHQKITDWQRKFQKDIGKSHASYFDKNNWLYFTKEVFDLLYPSYGDTYPSFNGAIGMTYEQGGSGRGGLAVITQTGDTLTLSQRVEHHVTTGLSTVELSGKKAEELIRHQQDYFKKQSAAIKGYVVSGSPEKIADLNQLLVKNQINMYVLKPNQTVKGLNHVTNQKEIYKTTGNEWFVPTNQRQSTLVQVLFESQTYLSDSLTYDITAWNIPFAFGLDVREASEDVLFSTDSPKNETKIEDAYAYVVHWNSLGSVRFLVACQKENINVSFTEKAFKTEGKSYEKGSLLILKADNLKVNLKEKLTKIQLESNAKVHCLQTGLVEDGSDLGTYTVKHIKQERGAIIVGDNFNSLSVGESWYFFEQDIKMPVTLLRQNQLLQALPRLDFLVYPEGNAGKEINDEILKWVENGGRLLVLGEGVDAFAETALLERKQSEIKEGDMGFAKSDRKQISGAITGAIFSTEMDNSHPLTFGIENYYTLRLRSDAYFSKSEKIISIHKEGKQKNGFVGHYAKSNQGGSIVVASVNHGNGSIVLMPDNPLFRGFWYNGKMLFSNALFFNGRW